MLMGMDLFVADCLLPFFSQEEEEELSGKVRNATLPDASDALCDNRCDNSLRFAAQLGPNLL